MIHYEQGPCLVRYQRPIVYTVGESLLQKQLVESNSIARFIAILRSYYFIRFLQPWQKSLLTGVVSCALRPRPCLQTSHSFKYFHSY